MQDRRKNKSSVLPNKAPNKVYANSAAFDTIDCGYPVDPEVVTVTLTLKNSLLKGLDLVVM
jgi:hypothetical protein